MAAQKPFRVLLHDVACPGCGSEEAIQHIGGGTLLRIGGAPASVYVGAFLRLFGFRAEAKEMARRAASELALDAVDRAPKGQAPVQTIRLKCRACGETWLLEGYRPPELLEILQGKGGENDG